MVMSVLVDLFIDPKTYFPRFRLGWSILVMEYVAVFAWSWLYILNSVETIFEAHSGWVVFFLWFEMSCGLIPEWIEDIICGGDMNQSYGNNGILNIFFDNFSTYGGYFIHLPLNFVLQYYCFSQFLRFPDFNQIVEKLPFFPVQWHPVKFDIMDKNLNKFDSISNNEELLLEQRFSNVSFLLVNIVFMQMTLNDMLRYLNKL